MLPVIITLLLVFLALSFIHLNPNLSLSNNYFKCQRNSLKECQVPTLNNEQCLMSKYYQCPRLNGSYKQCTNNYWSYDGICDCENRAFELCPYPYKVDGVCYNQKLNKCPSLTDKERDIVHEPCENPRINMFHSANKIFKNVKVNN